MEINRYVIVIVIMGMLLLGTGMASAHFTMVYPGGDMDVTPEDYIAELGETKTVWIVWGHPYEHILFDMTSVPEVSAVDPDGTATTLTPTQITVGGKVAYQVSFTVTKMGDWIITTKYEDEGEALIDYVKAVVHCGEEMWTGWDGVIGQNAEAVPYTRPYGLEEGFVFTGKALYKGSAMQNADVEVEVYHTEDVADGIVTKAEEMYPYDPPMMFTRVTKTNANGEFAYTLDEPGIWFIGAYGPEENGLTQRGIIIVPVLNAFPPVTTSTTTSTTTATTAAATPAPSQPGFEVVFAITGLLAVACIVLLKRRT